MGFSLREGSNVGNAEWIIEIGVELELLVLQSLNCF